MTAQGRWRQSWTGALVAVSYAVLAIAFSWPLARDLSTQLPGSPTGDTGVYVWNLWVFRDALLRGEWPFSTSAILALAPSVNLSLENYTVFQDVLALPLLSVLSATETFNVIFLCMSVLTASCMYLLARTVTPSRAIAWLAGVAFAWSPVLVARSTAHMSLVAAAPLPLFVLALQRALARPVPRRWALVGVVGAWAAYCDVYFAVFTSILGGLMVGANLWHWTVAPRELTPRLARARTALLSVIGVLLALSIWIGVTGGHSFDLLGTIVHVRTLYTPMLLVSVLGVAAWSLGCSCRVARSVQPIRPTAVGLGIATAVAAVLLSPWLVGVVAFVMNEGSVNPAVRWRSSPAGVDLTAYFLPNPNSPLWASAESWLATRPGGFAENVASVPWTLLLTIAIAWRLWRADAAGARWFWRSLLFAALALGPFVHVASVNSGIVTPWTLLRYAPLVGWARTPARFSILVALASALLFAVALTKLCERLTAGRASLLTAACGLVLLAELSPMPRPVHAARPPSVYQVIADDPRDVRVLELPFGIRDGTFSLGNYSAASQYYQTWHQKRLTGGYLSRLPHSTWDLYTAGPFFRTLMELSEGHAATFTPREVLVARGRQRSQDLGIAYVVVDEQRTSRELLELVRDAFDLRLMAEDSTIALYSTSVGRDGAGTTTRMMPARAPVPPSPTPRQTVALLPAPLRARR